MLKVLSEALPTSSADAAFLVRARERHLVDRKGIMRIVVVAVAAAIAIVAAESGCAPLGPQIYYSPYPSPPPGPELYGGPYTDAPPSAELYGSPYPGSSPEPESGPYQGSTRSPELYGRPYNQGYEPNGGDYRR